MTSFVVFCAISCAVAAEIEQTETEFVVFSQAYDTTYTTRVPSVLVDRASQWPEESEEPPLSPANAIKAAAKMKKSLVKDHHEFKLGSLELMRFGSGWVWIAKFAVSPMPDDSGPPHEIQIVVLMNGKAMKPDVEVVPVLVEKQ